MSAGAPHTPAEPRPSNDLGASHAAAQSTRAGGAPGGSPHPYGRSGQSSNWPSVAAWRAADPRRAGSREVWLGSEWYTTRSRPPWRAMWLAATGEFVVVQLTGASDDQHGPVELLAVVPELATLEVGLRAWPQITGWAGSLPWLRRRVAEL